MPDLNHLFTGGGLAPSVLAASLLAGLVRGYTGFGAAMVFMPIASTSLGPKAAIAVLWLVDAVMQLPMVGKARKLAGYRDIALLLPGALVGAPVGALILSQSDPLALRWALCVLILCAVAVMASGWRYEGEPARRATLGIGLVSGLFSGAVSLGGMPIALFWLAGRGSNAAVRASIVMLFLFTGVITGLSYAAVGAFTAEVWPAALVALPLYGAGLLAGSALFERAGNRAFRPVAFAVILFAAISSLPLLDPWLRG